METKTSLQISSIIFIIGFYKADKFLVEKQRYFPVIRENGDYFTVILDLVQLPVWLKCSSALY